MADKRRARTTATSPSPSVAVSPGCVGSHSSPDPSGLADNIIFGCTCTQSNIKACATMKPPLVEDTSRLVDEDGYTRTSLRCYSNAAKNKVYYADKGVRLHRVEGYLGVSAKGVPQDVYLIFGTQAFKDTYAKCAKTGYFHGSTPMSASDIPYQFHQWLEDDGGNVYDHVDATWLHTANAYGGDLRAPVGTKLVRVSKEKAFQEHGLFYMVRGKEFGAI